MKQWLIGGALILGLAGCASQAIDRMNSGLNFAMSQNVSHLVDALGQPAETSDDADQLDIAWFKKVTSSPVILKFGLIWMGLFEKPVGVVIEEHVSLLPRG